MNRLGRYALIWLAASAALALFGRRRHIASPLRLLAAAVTGDRLHPGHLVRLPPPQTQTARRAKPKHRASTKRAPKRASRSRPSS